MRFGFRQQRNPADFVEVGTCMYGEHPIPAGDLYVSVLYSRERYDGQAAVTVDECGALLFACMQHAPSEEAVIHALRWWGMPV